LTEPAAATPPRHLFAAVAADVFTYAAYEALMERIAGRERQR
jgi:hypothetical protein